MPHQTATAFSWILKLNGTDIGVPFGNVRFSEAVSGFGTSGVSVGQLDVDVYDVNGTYGEALLENATLQLVEANSYCLPSKTYYICKRSINNKVCHFVAYDIMHRVDDTFDTSGILYYDDKNAIPCGNVMEGIKSQCGFTGIFFSGAGANLITFKLEQLTNKSHRAVLEMVAEAMAGVWIAEYDNSIVLSCLGAEYDPSYGIIDAPHYSEIEYQGRQKITGIVFANPDTGVVNILQTGEYGIILNIESPFVGNTALDGAVWERVQNYIYQAWSCEKALVDGLVLASSVVGFGGTDMRVNNVSVDVDSTGIYFSGGCVPQDEEQWKYHEYLERTKVGIGKAVGNTVIDSNGTIRFVNRNKEGVDPDGFDNGICYYRDENI